MQIGFCIAMAIIFWDLEIKELSFLNLFAIMLLLLAIFKIG